jgi:hypothetical protein
VSVTDDFLPRQRALQGAFLTATHPAEAGHAGAPYRFADAHRALNLAPDIREAASDYFDRLYQISWHRYASHGLSSQASCLNFLMPLATRPDRLGQVIGQAVGLTDIRMLPVETGAFGAPWYVGFEWIGRADYLNEWPKSGRATRGANVTSADAIVRFEHAGRIETLLIEWKYGEAYGAAPDPSKSATRLGRYAPLAFAPVGPLRTDLGIDLADLLYEPFYQLLRQQMLAMRMEAAREDDAERVRVLHLSPAGNRALHRVTSPALRRFDDDAFEVFTGLMVEPDRLIVRTHEAVFGPWLAQPGDDPWADYLARRYAGITLGA